MESSRKGGREEGRADAQMGAGEQPRAGATLTAGLLSGVSWVGP